MKWIDSCMFNGESIIRLRLEYLFNDVDVFYICEQRYTHQGSRKDILFFEKYAEWFTPYMSKIVMLIDENIIYGSSWDKENAHRNYATQYIYDNHVNEKYVLSVCDCDEIPNIESVKSKKDLYDLCSEGAVYMDQKLFYYNLNWYIGPWKRAYFLNDITFNTYSNLQIFRDGSGPTTGLFDCGWHLSYFMNKEGIVNKIESNAHAEVNKTEFKDGNYIYRCMKEGMFLFNINHNDKESSFQGTKITLTKYSGNFPECFIRFNEELLKLQD